MGLINNLHTGDTEIVFRVISLHQKKKKIFQFSQYVLWVFFLLPLSLCLIGSKVGYFLGRPPPSWWQNVNRGYLHLGRETCEPALPWLDLGSAGSVDLGGSLSLSGGPAESAEALCLGGGLAGRWGNMDATKIVNSSIKVSPPWESAGSATLWQPLPRCWRPSCWSLGEGGSGQTWGEGGWCSFVFFTFHHGLLLACKLRFVAYTCSRREKWRNKDLTGKLELCTCLPLNATKIWINAPKHVNMLSVHVA